MLDKRAQALKRESFGGMVTIEKSADIRWYCGGVANEGVSNGDRMVCEVVEGVFCVGCDSYCLA